MNRITFTNPDGSLIVQFVNVCKVCGRDYQTGVNLDQHPEAVGKRRCVECVIEAEARA